MLIALAAFASAIIILAASVVLIAPSSATPASFPEIGYQLSSTVLSENFNSSPSDLTLRVSSTAKVNYDCTEDGLRITFNTTSSYLYVQKLSTRANVARCVVNVSNLDDSHFLDMKFNFKVKSQPFWYYGVTIRMSSDWVRLIPNVWLGDGTPLIQTYFFYYDVQERGSLDIVVKVQSGNILVGIDGFEKTLKTDYKVYTDLMFDKVTFTSNSIEWSSPADIVVKRIEIGNGAQVAYHDRLHKTITPWGHDFTIALQLHADYATPSQLILMKYLADNYGVRGEFDAWVDSPEPDYQYSILTDDNYSAELQNLQSSGWDIGLHAVQYQSTPRDELLSLIDQFEEEFGPLESWTDHGNAAQDIYLYGNDPNSTYYISDRLLQENVMIWVNNISQSHSPVNDLNLDSVMYYDHSFPNLELMKTSKYNFVGETTGWYESYAPVTQDELSELQRIYASNSAVLIWHDYAYHYCYINDGGVNYSTQDNSGMGFPYTVITPEELEEEGANIHPNGTWYLKPVAEEFFAAMQQDYDAWYATPREVYDRSISIGQLIVRENETQVTITNPSESDIVGLTLFTKEKPNYHLQIGNTSYYANEGSENYQFVIPEVAAGITIALVKTGTSSADRTDGGALGQQISWFCLSLKPHGLGLNGMLLLASNEVGDGSLIVFMKSVITRIVSYGN